MECLCFDKLLMALLLRSDFGLMNLYSVNNSTIYRINCLPLQANF